jgi:GAF domain-containing protein
LTEEDLSLRDESIKKGNSQRRDGWNRRLAGWLIEPSPSIIEVEQIRQARLLAVFLLGLAALTILGTLMPAMMGMVNPLSDPFILVMALTSVVMLLAYGLSRTRRYAIGAWLAVAALSALPFALLLTRQDFDPVRVPSIFSWLILALLFGSIFLQPRGILLVGAAHVAALLALPRLVPEVPFEILFPPLSLVVVVDLLLLVAVRNRNTLERVRNIDLTEKNRELQTLKGTLETQVRSRTLALEKRLNQLRTAAEISRSFSAVLDLDELLPLVVDKIQDGFGLYYVGLFLLDEHASYALLKAGSGAAGQKMLSEGHRLAVGEASMIGQAIANKEPRIAQDVGKAAIHFNNPHLPHTRAELALPVMLGNQILGALTIQSKMASAFDPDDITILQGISDALAIAINNARLFQQVQSSLQEINALHRNYLADAWSPESTLRSDLTFEVDRSTPDDAGADPVTLDVPLTLRDQVIGELSLEASKQEWTSEEAAFVEAVTNQAAVALENARLLEETRQRVERERIVSEITGKLWATTDVDTMLRTGLRELGRALNASEAFIQLSVEPSPTADSAEDDLPA